MVTMMTTQRQPAAIRLAGDAAQFYPSFSEELTEHNPSLLQYR